MFAENIKVEYLKPELWTNLGKILHLFRPEEKVLHVIKSGKTYRGVTSKGEAVQVDEFFRDNTDFDEIRYYTLEGLEHFYEKIQDRNVYNYDIEEYMKFLYKVQENTEGIEIIRRHPHKNRWYMERFEEILKEREREVIFIWITDNDKLFFNCILEVQHARIIGLSTSDRYHEHYSDYETVCERMKKEYNCPVRYVKMEYREIENRGNP